MRHDHGSQYMSDALQKELVFLGIKSSPAFVRAPEGKGCAERFIRTLKENLLWVRTFNTVEDLRRALLDFRQTYNTTWRIERHGFRPPSAIRAEQLHPRPAPRRLNHGVSSTAHGVSPTAGDTESRRAVRVGRRLLPGTS